MNKLSAAWLGFDGDRLYLNLKKSVNALQNVRQGVSKSFGAQALGLERVKRIHRSIYR